MEETIALLNTSDPEIQRHASRAIERVAAWNESTTEKALPATGILVKNLNNKSEKVRSNCIDALQMIAHQDPIKLEGAVSEIVPLVHDSYWQVLCGAVRTLRPIADRSPDKLKEYLPTIQPLLADDDWRVRRDTVILIGRISSKGVLDDLEIVQERDSSNIVQSAAEEAIQEIQTK